MPSSRDVHVFLRRLRRFFSSSLFSSCLFFSRREFHGFLLRFRHSRRDCFPHALFRRSRRGRRRLRSRVRAYRPPPLPPLATSSSSSSSSSSQRRPKMMMRRIIIIIIIIAQRQTRRQNDVTQNECWRYRLRRLRLPPFVQNEKSRGLELFLPTPLLATTFQRAILMMMMMMMMMMTMNAQHSRH